MPPPPQNRDERLSISPLSSLLRIEDNRPLSLSPLLPSLPLSNARSSVQSVTQSVSEGEREGGRVNIMLRWMKKGNDVLLLQGKQKPAGDREGGEGEGGWRRKRFVRFGASPPARSLDSGADCALGEMSPCTILRRSRRRPKYVADRLHAAVFLHTSSLMLTMSQTLAPFIRLCQREDGRNEGRKEGSSETTSSRGGGRNSASEGSGAQWRILILHSI